jgi:hypothetical protein
VRETQYRALQQVNQQQMQLYWHLGRFIAERQQQHGWGKSLGWRWAATLPASATSAGWS